MSFLEREKTLDFAEAVIALVSSIPLDIWGRGGETGIGNFGVWESLGSWIFSAMVVKGKDLQEKERGEKGSGVLIKKRERER